MPKAQGDRELGLPPREAATVGTRAYCASKAIANNRRHEGFYRAFMAEERKRLEHSSKFKVQANSFPNSNNFLRSDDRLTPTAKATSRTEYQNRQCLEAWSCRTLFPNENAHIDRFWKVLQPKRLRV